jgi:hypothetical protein
MMKTRQSMSREQWRSRPIDDATDAGGVQVHRETTPSAEVLREWDQLVERSTGTDVTQLSCWATIRAGAGFSPIYLLAYRGAELVGGALVLKRKLFGVLPIGYLPYGPLVDSDVESAQQVTSALIGAVIDLARRLTLTFVQPPEGSDHVSDRLLDNGFRASHVGIAPAGSYRVDLTPPLDTIRSGFSKRLKSWTNRWEAKGVKVRLGDETDLPLLAELMVHTADAQSFTPPTLDALQLLYRELSAVGHAAIFIGEVNGRAVSADLVSMMGDTVRGRRGGFDRSGDAGKLSVPAAGTHQVGQRARLSLA